MSNESIMEDSNDPSPDTRKRRGKREGTPPPEGSSPEDSAKKLKRAEHAETSFGELVHRIVTETEKTHPHLIRFIEDGSAFMVSGPREELGVIMTKYFPRKYNNC
jgi:hypothetical protein